MKNKFTTILITFIIIFLVAFGVYYFFFKNGDNVVINPPREDDPFNLESEDRLIDTETGDEDSSKLSSEGSSSSPYRKLNLHPVAGFSWFSGEDIYPIEREEGEVDLISYEINKGDVIRYIDRERGHVYETYTNSTDVIRLSNTTIPRVQEAFVLAEGSLIFRYLDENSDTIRTFIGNLRQRTNEEKSSQSTGSQTEFVTEGSFLVNDIKWLTTSSKKDSFIYSVSNQGGGLSIFSSDLTAENPSRISVLDTSEWIIDWINSGTLSFTTKSSVVASGYTYTMPSRGGNLTPVLGSQKGFMAKMSPNEDYVIFSTNKRNTSPALSIYTITNGTTREIRVSTFADKCAWSTNSTYVYCAEPQELPSGDYPDDWYMGIISSNDVFWRIDASTGTTELLLNPRDFDQDYVDAENLTVSNDGSYLLFTDKKTSDLWSIKLPSS